MKSAKKKSLTLSQKIQSHRLLLGFVLLGILVMILVGQLAYRSNQERRASDLAFQSDKARFAQIEKDVEAVKANLDPELQPGDKTEISRVCSLKSAKYESGTLICSVALTIDYADKNMDKTHSIKEAALQTGRFNAKEPILQTTHRAADNLFMTEVFLYRSTSGDDFCRIYQQDYGLPLYTFACRRVVVEPVYRSAE